VKTTKKIEPIIVIDTREQLPYSFSGRNAEIGTLKSGDYSIKGYDDKFAIERKTLGDFAACVAGGRERFEREIQRLAKLEFAAVVIEANYDDILEADLFTNVSRNSIINTAFKWTLKYHIPFVFVSNRAGGECAITNYVDAYFKYVVYGDKCW